jgi:hypothetical protein
MPPKRSSNRSKQRGSNASVTSTSALSRADRRKIITQKRSTPTRPRVVASTTNDVDVASPLSTATGLSPGLPTADDAGKSPGTIPTADANAKSPGIPTADAVAILRQSWWGVYSEWGSGDEYRTKEEVMRMIFKNRARQRELNYLWGGSRDSIFSERVSATY